MVDRAVSRTAAEARRPPVATKYRRKWRASVPGSRSYGFLDAALVWLMFKTICAIHCLFFVDNILFCCRFANLHSVVNKACFDRCPP